LTKKSVVSSKAYKDADRTLREHWDKVELVAVALLKYETLDAEKSASSAAARRSIVRASPACSPTKMFHPRSPTGHPAPRRPSA